MGTTFGLDGRGQKWVVDAFQKVRPGFRMCDAGRAALPVVRGGRWAAARVDDRVLGRCRRAVTAVDAVGDARRLSSETTTVDLGGGAHLTIPSGAITPDAQVTARFHNAPAADEGMASVGSPIELTLERRPRTLRLAGPSLGPRLGPRPRVWTAGRSA